MQLGKVLWTVSFISLVSFSCKSRHSQSSSDGAFSSVISPREADLIVCVDQSTNDDKQIYDCGKENMTHAKKEVDLKKTNVIYIFTTQNEEGKKNKYVCEEKYTSEEFEKNRKDLLKYCDATAFQAWNIYFVDGTHLSTCENPLFLRGGDGVCRDYARCHDDEFLAVDNKCYPRKQPSVAQNSKCSIREIKMSDGTCLDKDTYAACVFEPDTGAIFTQYTHDEIARLDIKDAATSSGEISKYCSRCANKISKSQPKANETSSNYCQ